VHYVRLEKSFLGKTDAYEMASHHDSIYYPNAIVEMQRWQDLEPKETFFFNEIDSIPRDSGIFSYSSNKLYAAVKQLDSESEYELKIQIPSTGKSISAKTHLMGPMSLQKPRRNPNTVTTVSFVSADPLEIDWTSAKNARIYLLQLNFHYLEVYGLDSVPKTATWRIAHYYSEHGDGGEKMEAIVNRTAFYRWLGNKLTVPESGFKRIALKSSLDITFTIGAEELYTYLEIYDPDQGFFKDKPVYTNISDGIGLFSARDDQVYAGYGLSFQSIDSLAHGQYTKELRFVDSTDDYYEK